MTKVKLSKIQEKLWELEQETQNIIFFIRDIQHFEDNYNKILIDKIEYAMEKIYKLIIEVDKL